MKTLQRRIEKLEKSAAPLVRARHAIADQALQKLSHPELESLISAFGADRAGRRLTELESASRQVYCSALEAAYRREQLRPPTSLERIPSPNVILQAIIDMSGHCVTYDQLELARAALDADRLGGVPTESELAAAHAFASVLGRLYQLTGVRSQEEFRRFYLQGGK